MMGIMYGLTNENRAYTQNFFVKTFGKQSFGRPNRRCGL